MMQAKGSYFLFVRATYTSPEHLSHHVKRINCFLLDDLYPFGSVTSSRVPWDKFWPPASSSGIPPLNVPKWNSERRLPLPPRETAPPVSRADRHSPKSWAFSLLSSRLVLHQHPVLPTASAPSFPDEAANSACCHSPEEPRAGFEDAAEWEGKGVTDFQFTTGARVGAGGGRGGLVDIVNGSRDLSACNSILSPGHCFLNHHK